MAELGWAGIVLPRGARRRGSRLRGARASCSRSAAARSRADAARSRPCCSARNALLLARATARSRRTCSARSPRARRCSRSRCRKARTTRRTGSPPRAEATADGFKLDRREDRSCSTATSPTQLIVVARTAGAAGERDGLGLFLVPTSARGLAVKRTTMVDSRNAASVALDGVEVDESRRRPRGRRARTLLDAGASTARTIGVAARAARHGDRGLRAHRPRT